jgi:hypothetical protein
MVGPQNTQPKTPPRMPAPTMTLCASGSADRSISSAVSTGLGPGTISKSRRMEVGSTEWLLFMMECCFWVSYRQVCDIFEETLADETRIKRPSRGAATDRHSMFPKVLRSPTKNVHDPRVISNSTLIGIINYSMVCTRYRSFFDCPSSLSRERVTNYPYQPL